MTEGICNGDGAILPIEDCSTQDLLHVKKFLKDDRFSAKNNVAGALEVFIRRPTLRRDILLLRGLFVHRILFMALNKRWNVQYGLEPLRDPIAVPYHAKGVPSATADWGHPDVAILLTCLSFYFGGLQMHQLKQSLTLILRSDDPGSEYDRWTKHAPSLPPALRTWTAVNLDDQAQCVDLLNHLSHNMVVVDYFLNNFVFPRHAKQFAQKLVSSGWDLPLLGAQRSTPHARILKENVPSEPKTDTAEPGTKTMVKSIGCVPGSKTTGFSGTNDNRGLPPLTIKQQDLSSLQHTNAEVLTYLLQPRKPEIRMRCQRRWEA